MKPISFLLFWAFIVDSSDLENDRKKWFNRINKYELIHVDLDAFYSTNLIQFDVFDNHYKVQLITNEDMSPILLVPNDDGTYDEHHPTDDESCYYHGKVLNDDESRVSLSVCEGEGIRGTIHAFGEKLFINPSNYYSAPYNQTALTDEHVIYKSSDYNWTEERAERGVLETATPSFTRENTESSTRVRRRLGGDGGQVELVTIIDDGWVENLGSVDAALSFFKGVVNDASNLYRYNNLPSAIEVTIKYRYTLLTAMPSCDFNAETDSPTWCLNRGKAKMAQLDYKFDYGFYFLRQTPYGGRSYGNKICSNGWNYGVSLSNEDRSGVAKVFAHELGHNLGAGEHDTDWGYIMDPYGTGDTWSSFSISQLEKNKAKGSWSCLRSSGMSGSVSGGNYDNKVDVNGGSGSYGDPVDNNNGVSCIKLYNFPDYPRDLGELNGRWSKSGSKYYQDTSSRYISQLSYGSSYYWTVNGGWDYGWCNEDDILKCGGSWRHSDISGGTGSIRTTSSCKNAFSFPACFDDYEDAMCFYFPDDKVGDMFELIYDEGCFNDAPVWMYSTYYLHYNDFNQWVITDGLISNDGEYTCEEEDLYQCVEGKWLYQVVVDDDVVALEIADDVSIKGCGSPIEMKEAKSSISVVPVVITIIIVLVIALIVCGGFMFYRYRSQSNKMVKGIELEDEDSVDEGDEALEEIDVKFTTNN